MVFLGLSKYNDSRLKCTARLWLMIGQRGHILEVYFTGFLGVSHMRQHTVLIFYAYCNLKQWPSYSGFGLLH